MASKWREFDRQLASDPSFHPSEIPKITSDSPVENTVVFTITTERTQRSFPSVKKKQGTRRGNVGI